MKVLTDTETLSSDVHSLSDYAGLQFFGLTALPLIQLDFSSHGRPRLNPLGASGWQSHGQMTEWTFQLDEERRWADGSPVLTSEYEAAFRTLLKDPKNRFRRLLSDLKGYAGFLRGDLEYEDLGIEITPGSIRLLFAQPNCFVPHLLSVANLSPVPEVRGLAAGPYVADRRRRLKRNPYFRYDLNEGQSCVPEIMFVLPNEVDAKDPFGLEAFDRGEVGLTCNTLFQAWQVSEFKNRPEFKIESDGLLAVLTLGDLAAEIPMELRRNLAGLIDNVDLSRDLNDIYEPISGYEGRGKQVNAKASGSFAFELSIAYEEFYPNRQILERLGGQLMAHGVRVTLLPEKYGSRGARTHLRFEIRQSPIGDPFLLYRGEARNPRFKSLSSRWTEYCMLLGMYQAQTDERSRRGLGVQMEKLLASEGVVLPLLEVPSLYLKDPRLNHHRFQIGHVWTMDPST